MIGVIGVDIDLFKRNDWVVNLTYFIIYARNFKVIDYEQYRNLRKCRS